LNGIGPRLADLKEGKRILLDRGKCGRGDLLLTEKKTISARSRKEMLRRSCRFVPLQRQLWTRGRNDRIQGKGGKKGDSTFSEGGGRYGVYRITWGNCQRGSGARGRAISLKKIRKDGAGGLRYVKGRNRGGGGDWDTHAGGGKKERRRLEQKLGDEGVRAASTGRPEGAERK